MNSIIAGIVLLNVLLHSNPALAASYVVGDATGWKFNVAGWENGKSFKACDTLVVEDKASYDACVVPGNAKSYSSGNDVITLGKGPNYFICGFPRHCGFGMKIAANAA
ncbi:basic blue protein-like [Salvia splendens]|uniref:basic blue protein-like n=1 Tax=Salvia splendens TaxID=180675 RepID=UPI001C27A930|nr:basic blue protein-like [Salvia splendens]